MGRVVLQACLPWLALLAVSCLCAYLLVKLNGSRLELGRLRRLHRDQIGSAQSLSFVLTLPVFVMIMLFIVQVSQVMIGTIAVHYAAYAAARSAVVWIPARVDQWEPENCISWFDEDPGAADNFRPVTDREAAGYGSPEALQGGVTFLIEPGGPKYEKIRMAAVMGCMPVAPSRDLGLDLPGESQAAGETVKALYGSMVPESDRNARIPLRLRNKLAYSQDSRVTQIEVRFFHPNSEPPLPKQYLINADVDGELPNENQIGWQDPVTVTVRHNLALLPGPGRMLARWVRQPDGSADRVAEKIDRIGGVYFYPLEASATMGNEGERSVIPYEYLNY